MANNTNKFDINEFEKIMNLNTNQTKEKEVKKITPKDEKLVGFKKTKGLVAGLIIGSVLTTGTVAITGCEHESKDKTTTEVDDTRTKSKLDLYDESTKDILDKKVEDYWDTLSDKTKAEFNNDVTYLRHFGYWINGIKINDFNENYIATIYEMINNADDLIGTALENDEIWDKEQNYIKATTFFPEESRFASFFKEREELRDIIVKNGLHSNESIEAAKKIMKLDIECNENINLKKSMCTFADLPPQLAELYSVTFCELAQPHLNVLDKNNIKSITLDVNGEKTEFPLILPPDYDNDSTKINEGGSPENCISEDFYIKRILDKITKCDNMEPTEELIEGDNPDTHRMLLEIQLGKTTSKKLDAIVTAKNELKTYRNEIEKQLNNNDKIIYAESDDLAFLATNNVRVRNS